MTYQTFLDGKMELYGGDCRDVIKSFPDNHFHSVTTDPPYALVSIQKRFGKGGAAPAKGNDAYMRASAGFMQATWDNGETAFAAEFWAEVLRVLKPGGHVVAFSGTRTYHRMAVAIEDAGFEIRDQLAWMYGSGFPKSHDVSKGIDKAARDGMVREKLMHFARTRGVDGRWLEERGIASAASFTDWTVGGHVPSEKNWQIVKSALGVTEAEEAEFERDTIGRSLNGIAGGSGEYVAGNSNSAGFKAEFDVTAPATAAAREWQGWGTALKPAWEPICLARKPLIGTVAANVLLHGTGAINIGACRVDANDNKTFDRLAGDRSREQYRTGTTGASRHTALGRWPTNIVHDGSDEVLAGFPSPHGAGAARLASDGTHAGDERNVYGGTGSSAPRIGDSGSAARFFYTAKADKGDRMGSKHPTVKPVDLMQWLVRMVTPKGGLVLDPFAGSGSTGEAAWREGMRCILIEREEEYQADIAARLKLADKGPSARKARAIKQSDNDNLPLFGLAFREDAFCQQHPPA